MKFFIPRTGPDNAELFYGGIRSFLTEDWGFPVTPRRIHKLVFDSKGRRSEAVVGKSFGVGTDIVYAIFETPAAYLICTPLHGVAGQPPVQVKRKEVVEVHDFDAAEAQQSA